MILAPILRASLDGFQKIAPILNVICIAFILAGLILAYGRQKKVQEAETEAAEEDNSKITEKSTAGESTSEKKSIPALRKILLMIMAAMILILIALLAALRIKEKKHHK